MNKSSLISVNFDDVAEKKNPEFSTEENILSVRNPSNTGRRVNHQPRLQRMKKTLLEPYMRFASKNVLYTSEKKDQDKSQIADKPLAEPQNLISQQNEHDYEHADYFNPKKDMPKYTSDDKTQGKKKARKRSPRFTPQWLDVKDELCKTWKNVTDRSKYKDVPMSKKRRENVKQKGVLMSSGLIGYLVGRRFGGYKDGMLGGLTLGTAMVVAAGALCFPKKTEENTKIPFHTVVKTGNAKIDKTDLVSHTMFFRKTMMKDKHILPLFELEIGKNCNEKESPVAVHCWR